MRIIKMLIVFILGFVTSLLITFYSLQVVNFETTESGALVTIKILNFYEDYYFEKQIKNL